MSATFIPTVRSTRMIEAMQYDFMQRALLAGILTGIVGSYYGAFIVQRGMSFLGNGLAHAAFGGVALGLLLQQEPLYIAIPFTVAVAALITWVRDKSGLGSDTVIGIFFALSMALGIVFLSRLPSQTTDAFTYLFGSILGVSNIDLWAIGFILLVTAFMLPMWGRWAYATIDREAAKADRLPVKFDDYLLSILVALVIVVSAKIIGVVLISAFLVIPAASARLVTYRFIGMTIVSVVLGLLTAAAGLMVSYSMDLPSGASIILLQVAVFVVCMFVGKGLRK